MKNSKIPLYGGGFALVDPEDYDRLIVYRWHKNDRGYARRTYDKGKCMYMHHAVLPRKKGFLNDHINGDKLDNRLCNLRYVNYSQSNSNRKMLKNNKSGYKGVYFDKNNNKWVSQLYFEKKRYFDYHDNMREALLAYNEKSKMIHKEFARK